MKKITYFGMIFAFLGCERIPDWERAEQRTKETSTARTHAELRRWIWACRGVGEKKETRTNSLASEISDFLDFFRSRNLSTIDSLQESEPLGTALLWNEKGYLILGLNHREDWRSLECTNGKFGWLSAEIRGFDPSLDIALLQLKSFQAPEFRADNKWMEWNGEIEPDQPMWVLSSALPGQVSKLLVTPQSFGLSLNTGLDEQLVLVLPKPSEISTGGVLVNHEWRVAGYMLETPGRVWGAAVKTAELESMVRSMIDTKRVARPYIGVRLVFDPGDKHFEVQQLEVGGPAYRAGLRVQDQITIWDGKPLQTFEAWQELTQVDIGRKIPISFVRGGKIFESELLVSASR